MPWLLLFAIYCQAFPDGVISLSSTMKAKMCSKSTKLSIESCLNKTCDQMQVLQSKIATTQTRLKRANRYKNSLATSSLKLQLQVLQDVYSTYYLYAEKAAHKMMIAEMEQMKLEQESHHRDWREYDLISQKVLIRANTSSQKSLISFAICTFSFPFT